MHGVLRMGESEDVFVLFWEISIDERVVSMLDCRL